MPIYKAQVKMVLENISKINPPSEDFDYMLKIECTSCHEEHENWVTVNATESNELHGNSSVEANFVYKCKLCKKHNHINVVKGSSKPYTSEDYPNFKEIIAFEGRGVAVKDISMGTGWSVHCSESKKCFEDVSLEEEFYDFDDEANCPVSISEMETKVV